MTREERIANANARAWLHVKEEVEARREEALAILAEQAHEAARCRPPLCACCRYDSGARGFTFLHHCLQCGMWFCRGCAKRHFAADPQPNSPAVREVVRLLSIPRGSKADHEGKELGSDWLLADLGEDFDGTHHYLTTNDVRV